MKVRWLKTNIDSTMTDGEEDIDDSKPLAQLLDYALVKAVEVHLEAGGTVRYEKAPEQPAAEGEGSVSV